MICYKIFLLRCFHRILYTYLSSKIKFDFRYLRKQLSDWLNKKLFYFNTIYFIQKIISLNAIVSKFLLRYLSNLLSNINQSFKNLTLLCYFNALSIYFRVFLYFTYSTIKFDCRCYQKLVLFRHY